MNYNELDTLTNETLEQIVIALVFDRIKESEPLGGPYKIFEGYDAEERDTRVEILDLKEVNPQNILVFPIIGGRCISTWSFTFRLDPEGNEYVTDFVLLEGTNSNFRVISPCTIDVRIQRLAINSSEQSHPCELCGALTTNNIVTPG